MVPLARLASAFLALVVTAALGLVAAPPAGASTTKLCTGYTACAEAGMSHDGYATAGNKMYWRMYAGHNCTNYVAYRMVRGGMANDRPWGTSGNATNWGVALADRTDQTPRVGSVAWWTANVPGAGASGHVAYVEQVVSADEIVVSQDSWGGDFSWARITRTGKGWPTGFIHLNDVPLLNLEEPAVDGTARVGTILTATPGTWSPSDVTLKYQWRADGALVPWVTSRTLRLKEHHLGKRIQVRVTASRPGYPSRTLLSAPTGPVQPGELSNEVPPDLAGTPAVDQTVTASPGRWTPAPERLTYEWLADGKPLAGAAGDRLPLRAGLVGKEVAVRVTAHLSRYDDVTVTSPATLRVRPGTLELRSRPRVFGTPRVGQPLRLSRGNTGLWAAPSVQWLRDGTPIDRATAATYTPTVADLGARLGARVTWRRTGYSPVTVTAPRTAVVKARPWVVVRTATGRGRVTFTTTVKAKGHAAVATQVRVRTPGRPAVVRQLHNGTVAVTLTGLRRGVRSFQISVTGTSTVAPATLTKRVGIR